MGPIRLLTAPIRRIANSRLFQLAVVVTVILLLDHYSYDYTPLLPIAEGLKKSVIATVELFSKYFRVGILTDPVLQVGLMIAYVYVVCLLVFFLLRRAIRCAGRPHRLEQFPVAQKHHRARARDRRLPRLGAARANTAGRLSAGAMGTTVRLAGRRQAALSTVAAAAAAQRDQLCRGLRRRCHTAPGLYAVSGADLARQALQRAGRSMSASQPSMPHRTTERGVLHA